jgi:hypothetical protein
MSRINIIELYRQAFGSYVASPLSMLNSGNVKERVNALDNLQTKDLRAEQETLMGTVLFMPCRLDGWQLPNEPMISISGSNNVIKTSIDGEGTFKEFYSKGDWEITIKGIAINEEDDNYPEEQVRRLRALIDKRRNIKIVNALATIFGIEKLVIEKYGFPPIEGAPSMQPYEFSCVSDRDFELVLKTRGN